MPNVSKTQQISADTVDLESSINRNLPYLMEIRKRLLFIAVAFVVAGAVGFIYYEKIIRGFLGIFELEGINIVYTSPFQFINLALTSAFCVAIVVTLPLIIIQTLSFLRPALSKSEFKTVLYLLPFSIVLFVLGFYFGLSMMKFIIEMFYEKSLAIDIGNILDVSNFLSKTLLTSTLMGVAFQYPIVLMLLTKFNVVKYQSLKKQRIYAYSASLVFAALLPPTDLLSLLVLTLPLVFLYEITLVLIKLFIKPNKPR